MAEPKTKPVVPNPVALQLPWHTAALEQFKLAWVSNRMSHALLLQGTEGTGKKHLAAWLGAAVLCETSRASELTVCGTCASCTLIKAGSHPDFFWVRPEEDKQQISVDQVRAACERLTKTSYREGYKVAIVEPAHRMTPSAANGLLKTLEEPSAESLIILITAQPSALLATVRSRCQKVPLPRPSVEQSTAWMMERTGQPLEAEVLEFAGGAPLRALELAEEFAGLHEQMQRALAALLKGDADVTQVAADWADDRLVDRLNWLDLWLASLARGTLAGTADLITFPKRSLHLPSPSRTLNISGVYSMVDRARALKAQLARTALQRELAMESWLIALLDVLAPAAASSQRGAFHNRSR